MSKDMLSAGLAHGKITLKNAAEAINGLHKEATQHCKASLQKAYEIGKLLHQARRHIKHGAFGVWVDEVCDFSVETANRYIKLFENWDELIEKAGPGQMSIMTISEGIKKINQIVKAKPAKSVTDETTASEGVKDDNCIKGGDHEPEYDRDLDGYFCAKCHERRPDAGHADGAGPEGDHEDQGELDAQEEPVQGLAERRLGDLRHRLVQLLGVAISLCDQIHQEAPEDEVTYNRVQDGLRIAHEDVQSWRF